MIMNIEPSQPPSEANRGPSGALPTAAAESRSKALCARGVSKLRSTCLGVCAAVVACALAGAQGAAVQEVSTEKAAGGRPAATRPAADPLAPSPDRSVIEEALQDYLAAFNRHDAAATGALWSPTGFYEDRDSGQCLEGREAIEADLADLFGRLPEIQLTIHADQVRFIGPDVAKVNGRAMVNTPGEDPRETGFSAIFTRHQDQWLLETAEETEWASPAAAGAVLKELEWLVGTWQDQSDDVRVETTIRWARGGSLLIWAYTIQANDEEKPREGTQVIGWDPRSRQIRSWTFESDGSFGEGTWSRSGDEWLARLTYTSATGELATATQIISKINNNRFKAQMVGLEIDGTPLPSLEPVMAVRVSTPEPLNSDPR